MLCHARNGADASGGDLDDQAFGPRNHMQFMRKCDFAQTQLSVLMTMMTHFQRWR